MITKSKMNTVLIVMTIVLLCVVNFMLVLICTGEDQAKPTAQKQYSYTEIQAQQIEIQRQELELERLKLISSCKASIVPSGEAMTDYLSELQCEAKYRV